MIQKLLNALSLSILLASLPLATLSSRSQEAKAQTSARPYVVPGHLANCDVTVCDAQKRHPGSNGTKQKRLFHDVITDDVYIQRQIVDKVKELIAQRENQISNRSNILDLNDIATMTQKAQDWAINNQFAGAIPTLHWGGTDSNPVYGAILIDQSAGEFRDIRLNIHPDNLGTTEGKRLILQGLMDFAVSNGYAGAIPTFHWGGSISNPVYGAVFISRSAGEFRDIPLSIHPDNLGTAQGQREIWQGVMDFAVNNGYAGAIPTLHWGGSVSNPVYGAILINRNSGEFRDIPLR